MADIVQSVNKGYLGVTYPSGIFNNDNEIIFADDVIKINRSYTNLTFFSDYWDKDIYLNQQRKKVNEIDYKLIEFDLNHFEKSLKNIDYNLVEAKDYFTPLETELVEYPVEEVIVDFFEEMQRGIKNGLNLTKYKINFLRLLENKDEVIYLSEILDNGTKLTESNSHNNIELDDDEKDKLLNLSKFFNNYFGIYYKLFIDFNENSTQLYKSEDVKIILVKIY